MPETPRTTERGLALIDGDAATFAGGFDRASFAFSHRLAGHPLFELPRLIELARSMPPGDIYYDAGDVGVGQRWDQMQPCQRSAEALIDSIEHAGAWILIRRARRDPEYAALLDRGLEEIQDLTGGAIRSDLVKKREALVFITSPGRVTPYHIDRECNFLLQVRGEKRIYIFDKADREVLPEAELERFWTVDNNAAVYKDHLQGRAREYHLRPGSGVHIPVNAPHWVKNSGEPSVTLSVNFQFADAVRAHIYWANFYLRWAGLSPVPPGRSGVRDAIKRVAGPRLLGLHKLYGRLRGGPAW